MTIDELAELGVKCLETYQGPLKINGVKTFDWSAERIAQRSECNLETMEPDQARPLIVSVLNELAAKGNVMMSEAKFTRPMACAELRNIRHKDLRLRFTYGFSIVDATSYLWVSCWYYPLV